MVAQVTLGLRVYKQIRRPESSVLERLANAGVGEISDAMHGRGVVDSAIHQIYSPMARIFGPALTVDVSPGDGMLLRGAVEAAQPGDIIVVNSHGNTTRAVLGGAVAMHMVHRGVRGLIVDGAIRDIAEFQALGLPVMARAVTPRSGTSANGWGEVNVPIACGGSVVEPGDIIVGDGEGLVIVPRRWANSVIAALGNTGHIEFAPTTIRERLAALTPDDAVPGSQNLHRAIAAHGGTLLDGLYDEE